MQNIDTEQLVELIRQCCEARCDYSDVVETCKWAGYHGGRPGYKEGETDPVKGHWANTRDLALKLGMPEDVLRAKLAELVEAGLVDGCACGCRGDFTVPGNPWGDHMRELRGWVANSR